jgi:hypothetical protein
MLGRPRHTQRFPRFATQIFAVDTLECSCEDQSASGGSGGNFECIEKYSAVDYRKSIMAYERVFPVDMVLRNHLRDLARRVARRRINPFQRPEKYLSGRSRYGNLCQLET